MRRGERGYTFIAVLALLAVCMLGVSLAAPVWSQQVKREREQELLRIGALYAQALASYRDASPGSLKQYPPRLEALLLDTRYVGVQRHLRKLYADPMNPGQPWGLVLDAEQRIVGVYSLSEEAPLAEGSARRYSDWKFIAKGKS
jgi:type II secretory pathway pseudopilin PulG